MLCDENAVQVVINATSACDEWSEQAKCASVVDCLINLIYLWASVQLDIDFKELVDRLKNGCDALRPAIELVVELHR